MTQLTWQFDISKSQAIIDSQYLNINLAVKLVSTIHSKGNCTENLFKQIRIADTESKESLGRITFTVDTGSGCYRSDGVFNVRLRNKFM
jgi:hypothetical protein